MVLYAIGPDHVGHAPTCPAWTSSIHNHRVCVDGVADEVRSDLYWMTRIAHDTQSLPRTKTTRSMGHRWPVHRWTGRLQAVGKKCRIGNEPHASG
jgi:hypothetical protein